MDAKLRNSRARTTQRTAVDTAALDPHQILALIDVWRDQALTIAGPAGMDMPVDQLRIGDQILTPAGWETVEQVHADTWCCDLPNIPGHRYKVLVVTEAHTFYEHGHQFVTGDVVRVRKAGQQ